MVGDLRSNVNFRKGKGVVGGNGVKWRQWGKRKFVYRELMVGELSGCMLCNARANFLFYGCRCTYKVVSHIT